jgi:hypothetical protein
MSEEIAPVPQETPEEPSAVPEPPVLEQPPTPQPKKRGRPQGTKDVVKRTRKPAVKLRVEPVAREPPPTSQAPVAEPPVQSVSVPAMQREPTPAYEPQSPKTLFRRYHDSILQERRQKKDEHAQRYVSNWARWPV